MLFEDGLGGTQELTPNLLASTCLMAGDTQTTCKVSVQFKGA